MGVYLFCRHNSNHSVFDGIPVVTLRLGAISVVAVCFGITSTVTVVFGTVVFGLIGTRHITPIQCESFAGHFVLGSAHISIEGNFFTIHQELTFPFHPTGTTV